MNNLLLSRLPSEIFNEILLFISNGNKFQNYFPQIRFSERTNTLLNLSQSCKELYEKLLFDKIILLNCKFTLKMNKKMRNFFIFNNQIKRISNYKISNLDLSFNEKISDEDFRILNKLQGVQFNLKKLKMNGLTKNVKI
jgi:hypothetical protein